MPESLIIIDDNTSFAKNLKRAILDRVSSFSAEDIVLLPDGDHKDSQTLLAFLKQYRKDRKDIKAVFINTNLRFSEQDSRAPTPSEQFW